MSLDLAIWSLVAVSVIRWMNDFLIERRNLKTHNRNLTMTESDLQKAREFIKLLKKENTDLRMEGFRNQDEMSIAGFIIQHNEVSAVTNRAMLKINKALAIEKEL